MRYIFVNLAVTSVKIIFNVILVLKNWRIELLIFITAEGERIDNIKLMMLCDRKTTIRRSI
jgi:hypothetical protein